MDTHVDWLSFTLETEHEPRTAMDLYLGSRQRLKENEQSIENTFFDGQGFNPSGGRSPYRVAISRDDNSARVYGSSHTSTYLYELTGRGCEPLRENKEYRIAIGRMADRITRIDFAVDIVCGTSPTDFTNSRRHNRFRSVSFIRSQTGETVYIGSAKSDRFCRVYRYNLPHPRAHILRVEFVFRRKLASHAAREYGESESVADFTSRLGNTYGYEHEQWRPGTETDERIRHPILDRSDANTIYWMYHQVAPAIKRMIETGAFDMVDWLEYVYGTANDE